MASPGPPASFFPYQHEEGRSLTAAVAIIVASLLLALLLPAAELRLLAALFAIPPALWRINQHRLSQTGLTLEVDHLSLRLPMGFRPKRIAYRAIGGAILADGARIGLAYAVARPPFEGAEDTRPPRRRTLSTYPLHNASDAAATLRQRIRAAERDSATFPLLSDEAVIQMLRRARLRRIALSIALLLASPLLVMLSVRMIFSLYAAVYHGLR